MSKGKIGVSMNFIGINSTDAQRMLLALIHSELTENQRNFINEQIMKNKHSADNKRKIKALYSERFNGSGYYE